MELFYLGFEVPDLFNLQTSFGSHRKAESIHLKEFFYRFFVVNFVFLLVFEGNP